MNCPYCSLTTGTERASHGHYWFSTWHWKGTPSSQCVFFHITWEKPVRIYVQAPMLHPTVIYGGSKSVTTEKKTQTGVERLTYAVSKTCWCLFLCFILDRRTQGTFSMPKEHLVYFERNQSSKSINCMAELLLLERFKQREALQVPKSTNSLQKWHKKLPWTVLLYWGCHIYLPKSILKWRKTRQVSSLNRKIQPAPSAASMVNQSNSLRCKTLPSWEMGQFHFHQDLSLQRRCEEL